MLKNCKIVTDDEGVSSVTMYRDGETCTANEDHPRYEDIVEGVINDDESVFGLFDVSETVAERFRNLSEHVTVSNGRIYFDGDEINNALTEQILRFLEYDSLGWLPLVNFMEKCYQNPNEHSREQLYNWLATRPFTITPSGDIVAYKGLEGDMRSVFSGTAIVNGEKVQGRIPNNVGSVVEMPRSSVVHEPSVGCSVGLHVSTLSFAEGYGSVRVVVLVNPRDVVSVPTECNAEKMRVCRYKVQEIISREITTPVADYPAWDEDDLDECDCEECREAEEDWDVR